MASSRKEILLGVDRSFSFGLNCELLWISKLGNKLLLPAVIINILRTVHSEMNKTGRSVCACVMAPNRMRVDLRPALQNFICLFSRNEISLSHFFESPDISLCFSSLLRYGTVFIEKCSIIKLILDLSVLYFNKLIIFNFYLNHSNISRTFHITFFYHSIIIYF